MRDPDDNRLADAYAHCNTMLRDGDRERWLANLFAPAEVRPNLHALYAFSLEIARIRDVVSDPRPGEIRYQWWREALEGAPRGDVVAHPVAHAILDTIAKFRLPIAAFTNLVDARTFDLYDDPMPGLRQLEGYCGETCSALFRLASIMLVEGRGAEATAHSGAEATAHAGVAYALIGLLRALPWHAARGQLYLPADRLAAHGASRDDVLQGRFSPGLRDFLAEIRLLARCRVAEAKKGMQDMQPAARISLLPIALVEPLLAQMDRADYNPFKSVVSLPPWRAQWILWRTSRQF